MLTNIAKPSLSRAIAPFAAGLARAGVTPNMITIVGTIGATAAAVGFFSQGWWFTGGVVITVFVLFDMLDGAVARATGITNPFGGVLDSTCDRVADAAIFGALAWWFAHHGQQWLLLASLLCLVLGSLTSYIRARAEAAGMTASVGFAERTERLIIVLTGTGLSGHNIAIPYLQAISLWFLVGASTITVGQRLATVYKQAKVIAAANTAAPTGPPSSPVGA